MLSDLLQASNDGDLNKVTQILAQPSVGDIIEQKGASVLPLLPSSPFFAPHHSLTLLFIPSYALFFRIYPSLPKTRTV
jgi:hypothetical protein